MYKEDFNLPAKVEEEKFSADLPGLIAWLETKSANAGYPYWNCSGGCLMGQFIKALGHEDGRFARVYDRWPGFSDAHFHVASRSPHTYGAALKRARALHRATSMNTLKTMRNALEGARLCQ